MTTYNQDLQGDKKLGFVLYLVGELVMFATLFATFFIFVQDAIDPTPTEVFEARTVIISSVFLLSSSGTIHFAEKAAEIQNRKGIAIWLAATVLLGLAFMGVEIHEFRTYYHEGFTLTQNIFLSSFYILVGLHAAHVLFGIGWMLLLAIQLNSIPSSIYGDKQKIFSYYWHFVDVIWIFIIVFVYAPYLI
ncbi:cytochrome aa3 quinol oxidase subunit III [Pontibacillus yanchengensis]|uniref:Cytochrome aa3 quinol oxidase subunit III n=1 Tax=Pontibacillus yanchengensis TaxID=462910 RepID=A0ACC7VKS3_9BACI|nr:cytochrome c oxidase subunit 3 [Pontibacillus yanchengensis]MYL54549.1 cytochrome aa3 quinol oxidase subunit III [Pontibacillus yanchengensis]